LSYTLFQLLRGASGGEGPAGLWLVLLLTGLAAAVAAGLLWSSAPSAGARLFALGVAVVLLLLMLVLVVVTASAAPRNSSATALTPATVLAGAAAIWLIVGARSSRS